MNCISFSNKIWSFIKSISEPLDNAIRPIVEDEGLTMVQLRILIKVEEGEHTVGSLANSIGLANTNASAMCKKLERSGYLIRNRDIKDERIVNLSLTNDGKLKVETINNKINKKYGAFFENKAESELESVCSGIEKLSTFINEMIKSRN